MELGQTTVHFVDQVGFLVYFIGGGAAYIDYANPKLTLDYAASIVHSMQDAVASTYRSQCCATCRQQVCAVSLARQQVCAVLLAASRYVLCNMPPDSMCCITCRRKHLP